MQPQTMKDWRPDLRLTVEDPFAREVARDLKKVEKARQRALKRQRQAAPSNTAGRMTTHPFAVMAAYLTLAAGLLFALHSNVESKAQNRTTIRYTCEALNQQKMREAQNMLYAYHVARDAGLDRQASRYRILALNVRKSMSECRH